MYIEKNINKIISKSIKYKKMVKTIQGQTFGQQILKMSNKKPLNKLSGFY